MPQREKTYLTRIIRHYPQMVESKGKCNITKND